MQKSNFPQIIMVSMVSAIFFGPFLSAQAIEYTGFGGLPAYPRTDNPRTESIFVHTLEPGTVQEEGVVVVNNTAETKTLLVYAADSTPSSGGAFACKQFVEDKTDVGSWLTLAKSEVTLGPTTKELVPFTILVPGNASVGEHNGCILIQEKKEKAEGQTGAILSVRTGLRVAITVPGEIVRKLEIVGFNVERKEGNFLLHPLVKNVGNVSIDTNVEVLTDYFFGLNYFTHDGQYPILRGSTSEWNFELKKPFWGGWYRSGFTIEYDESTDASVGVITGKTLTKLTGPSVWFWSFPTPIALAIEIGVLLLIIFFIFILWRRHKREKEIDDTWVEYTVVQGDDINALALKYGVSWEMLAKANKLPPPYDLNAGQKIKVPPTHQTSSTQVTPPTQ